MSPGVGVGRPQVRFPPSCDQASAWASALATLFLSPPHKGDSGHEGTYQPAQVDGLLSQVRRQSPWAGAHGEGEGGGHMKPLGLSWAGDGQGRGAGLATAHGLSLRPGWTTENRPLFLLLKRVSCPPAPPLPTHPPHPIPRTLSTKVSWRPLLTSLQAQSSLVRL